jgi:very-short-patch-repair endonuclease
VNATVAGLEVDALWPREKLIVELDGFEFHRTRAAFERDRARDAVLQANGYRVLRLTQRRLTNEPAATAEVIRRFLDAGG